MQTCIPNTLHIAVLPVMLGIRLSPLLERTPILRRSIVRMQIGKPLSGKLVRFYRGGRSVRWFHHSTTREQAAQQSSRMEIYPFIPIDVREGARPEQFVGSRGIFL